MFDRLPIGLRACCIPGGPSSCQYHVMCKLSATKTVNLKSCPALVVPVPNYKVRRLLRLGTPVPAPSQLTTPIDAILSIAASFSTSANVRRSLRGLTPIISLHTLSTPSALENPPGLEHRGIACVTVVLFSQASG